jgi:hypothetical protein
MIQLVLNKVGAQEFGIELKNYFVYIEKYKVKTK